MDKPPPNWSWLEAKPTQRLIAALDAAGIDFRFVGGAVRDTLLGRRFVSDVDVATPAKPEIVAPALEKAGLKVIPTGLAHGTLTVVCSGRHFEVTTLRRDVETDGRRAVVAFTDDWKEDAARRDFTMNALYADRARHITDFFGGVADAEAGRIRFIGDADQRIVEDALRILRFFRFHAHYGRGAPDKTGLAACTRAAASLRKLSGERVRDEILKLLGGADPAPVWRIMRDSGIIQQRLPEAVDVDALASMVALENTFALESDSLRRLAALTGPIAENLADRLKDELKLSNRQHAYLRSLEKLASRVARIENADFGGALYGAEPDWVRDAALLSRVRGGQPGDAALAALLKFIGTWRQPKFPLTGSDLEALGVKPGPNFGKLLDELEAWWVAQGFTPDRAACLAELKRRS